MSCRSPGAHRPSASAARHGSSERNVMTGKTALEIDEATISRIAVEYIEMPDLKLTAGQARRLWNLSAEVCDRALATLVARGFLMQTRTGAFLRRSSGAPVSLPK